MLMTQLRKDLTDSMKQGNAVAVETIRFLISAIKNAAITKYGATGESALTDADVLESVKKQVKSHRESIDAFARAGRKDLVEKESAQLAVLEQYMPKQLSDDELKQIVAPIVAGGETNFGLLMKAAKEAAGDGADGGRISTMIRSLMQTK